jgi:hypothetical protein
VEKTGMLEARRHAAGAVVGGKLYAVGGMVGGSEDQLATAEVYDPLSDTWSSVPELGQARAGAAAFGYGRRLVACGGRAAAPLASCEVYDPMSGGPPAAPGLCGGWQCAIRFGRLSYEHS